MFQWCKGESFTLSGQGSRQTQTLFPSSFNSVYNCQLTLNSATSCAFMEYILTNTSVDYLASNLTGSAVIVYFHILAVGC